jgi:hypothetical protein
MARWGSTRWGEGRWGEGSVPEAPGIVGDITIGISVAADLAYQLHRAIVGDVALAFSSAADLEFSAYAPGIAGSITITVLPTATKKYTQAVALPAPKGLRLVSWLRPAL